MIMQKQNHFLKQQTQQVQIKNSALRELNSEISSLVEKITPSVVNITVTIKQLDSSGNQTLQQGVGAGISFAIPSDTATNIANQIIKYGKPVIPFIGVNMDVNNTKIAGVFVKSVVADSPAEKAGVQANDILVEFSGKKITNPFDLLTQILRKNCGETIPVKIYRNGNYLTINTLLDQCPLPLKK